MENQASLVELLNDLIIINNDRLEGYEKAASEAKELALKGLFEALARDSRKFSSELSIETAKLGGVVSTGTSTAGSIYRAWMNLNAKLSKNDPVSILNLCEEGENVAIEGYQRALVSSTVLPPYLAEKLQEHKRLISEGLHAIIKLRDTVYANA